jgi:hypothetical protein
VTGIWNGFFVKSRRPAAAGGDIIGWVTAEEWDERDRWADACVPLFRALVLYPLEIDTELVPEYWGEWAALDFHVEWSGSTKMYMTRNADRYVSWDTNTPIEARQGDLSLRFVRFFDWSPLDTRTFEWVEALVVESSIDPALVGRRALVKTDEVRFMFDERSVPTA